MEIPVIVTLRNALNYFVTQVQELKNNCTTIFLLCSNISQEMRIKKIQHSRAHFLLLVTFLNR